MLTLDTLLASDENVWVLCVDEDSAKTHTKYDYYF